MDFYKDLTPNLCVLHSETLRHNDAGLPDKVRFNCTFYEAFFVADVTARNVEEDTASIEYEGPSELAESFEDQMEGDHWQALREMFHQHVSGKAPGSDSERKLITVKTLEVTVTYKVGLGNVEMPPEVHAQLLDAAKMSDEIQLNSQEYPEACEWLSHHIEERDCCDWRCEVDDISDESDEEESE